MTPENKKLMGEWYSYLDTDCRSCSHYDTMRGRCISITECINAANYKGKPMIQLWRVKK